MRSQLQDARRDLVRERVFAGVHAVLAADEDLTFAKVAQASGVSERTLYRHFPTRADLLGGAYAWANDRMGLEARPRTRAEATAVVRRAFPTFDELAPVIRELLAAPEGLTARLADNADRRRSAVALVRAERPDLEPRAARRLAAVVQLLGSAAAWQGLRDYWELDGKEAAEACALAIDLLLSPS